MYFVTVKGPVKSTDWKILWGMSQNRRDSEWNQLLTWISKMESLCVGLSMMIKTNNMFLLSASRIHFLRSFNLPKNLPSEIINTICMDSTWAKADLTRADSSNFTAVSTKRWVFVLSCSKENCDTTWNKLLRTIPRFYFQSHLWPKCCSKWLFERVQ